MICFALRCFKFEKELVKQSSRTSFYSKGDKNKKIIIFPCTGLDDILESI